MLKAQLNACIYRFCLDLQNALNSPLPEPIILTMDFNFRSTFLYLFICASVTHSLIFS